MRVGVDILDHSRISVLMNDMDDPFWSRTFSPAEHIEAAARESKLSYYCGRFAAKEAVMKCLPSLEGLKETDIEILTAKNGAPFLRLKGDISEISLSISHEDNYSVAFAVYND